MNPIQEFRAYFSIVAVVIKNRLIGFIVFFSTVFGLISLYLTTFVSLWAMLEKFGSIGSWDRGSVIFIYALALMSYGVRVLFSFGMVFFDEDVRRGHFDITAIRPMSSLLYQLGLSFQLSGISHIMAGLFIFLFFQESFSIDMSPLNIVVLALAVFSSGLVQVAITIVIATVSFFLVNTRGLNAFYIGMREFTFYPVTIFNKFVIIILFTILPLAFTTYVPAGIFLDRPEFEILPQPVWMFLSLSAGPFFLFLASRFWYFGVRFYQGTGN